jgi:predicted pyridoxine 5'-phosphate oxidase superfamily flavin-nucleotide-binding protein
MAYAFGSLVFTPLVKELQERFGSRRQYAKREESGFSPAVIGPDEEQFLSERDSFYMATVGVSGWPYVQHRGGPAGFLKVIDERTIAFADFGGNKQFITTGNLMSDDRVAIILVDYPRQARLKMLGRVRTFEGAAADEWLEKVRDPDYKAGIMRVFVIDVEASDWNCQQHITPRFTQEQIRTVLMPFERRMQALEAENQKLRRELAQLRQPFDSA